MKSEQVTCPTAKSTGREGKMKQADLLDTIPVYFTILILNIFLACGNGCSNRENSANSVNPSPSDKLQSYQGSKTFSDWYTFEAINIWGSELDIIKNFTNQQECARLCDINPACKVASFHGSHATGGWAHTCVLRREAGARHPEQIGIYSWIKPEPE
jgi:PAN domain